MDETPENNTKTPIAGLEGKKIIHGHCGYDTARTVLAFIIIACIFIMIGLFIYSYSKSGSINLGKEDDIALQDVINTPFPKKIILAGALFNVWFIALMVYIAIPLCDNHEIVDM